MKHINRLLIIVSCICCSLATIAQTKLVAYTEMDPATQLESPLFSGTVKLLDASGYQYTLESTPWVRSYKQALINKNSIVFPIYRTAERESLFHWFCPIASARDIFLFKLSKNQHLHINNIEQAKQFSIGIVRSTMIHDFLLKNGFNESLQLDITAYGKTNFTKLLNNRVDFIAQSPERMMALLEQFNLSPSTVTKEYLLFDRFKYPLCAAANINMAPAIIKKLRNAFIQTIDVQTLEQPREVQQFKMCKH